MTAGIRVRHQVPGRPEKLPVQRAAAQRHPQQRQAGGQIHHASSSTKRVVEGSRRGSSTSQATTGAVDWSHGLRGRRLRCLPGQDQIAHPRGAATTTGCPCASWRRECAAFFGRGHSTRWSSRAIERAERIASPGLAQTAIVIGHKAQIGRLPIAYAPFAPGNRISVYCQQPVPDPILRLP